MNVRIDLWPHPLTGEGRAVRDFALDGVCTVAALLDRVFDGVVHPEHVAVALDGEPVAPGDWSAAPLRDGLIVTVRRTLHGGGGDSDARQVFLVAATIVAAHYGGPALAGSAFGQAIGLSEGVASSLILFGGGLVAQTLATPPAAPSAPPDVPAAEGRGFAPATTANRARPHQPMQLVLGRHRIFPNRVTDAELRLDDNDVLSVRVLVSWGIGDLAIGDLQIGSAPLATYAGVVQQTWLPGASPWGSTDRIARVQAVEVDMEKTSSVSRTAHPDAVGWRALFQSRLGFIDDDGESRARSVSIRHGADTTTWTGSNFDLEQHEIAATLSGPGVSKDVRFRRAAAATRDARRADDVRWLSLVSLLPVPSSLDRGADTLTRIDVRMSDQVGPRLDSIHAVAEQRVPIWDGAAWSAARSPSSNPAAIFRAFARGWRSAAGVLLAGAGLAENEVDDAILGAWFDWCAAHEPVLSCNLVVDSDMTAQHLLDVVARCGRASVSWQTGRLGVVWERERPVSAAITPERIVAGTMSVAWAGDRVADEIVMRYTDPSHDWTVREVRARPPGAVGSARHTATIDGRGVTNAAQAVALASLQAAHQALHRRRFTWQMGAAGIGLGRGDVVTLSHALVTGGVGGRARAVGERSVALDRDVDVPAGATLLVSGPDGSMAQPGIQSVEGAPPVLILDADLPDAITASRPEDVAWRIYPPGETPLPVRIVALAPRSEARVSVTAIDEVPDYRPALSGAPGTIEIAASGAHVWQGPGTTALVWLRSGEGGRGGDGGRAGARASSGPGGPGGAGGRGGSHAAGGRADAGGEGHHGRRSRTHYTYESENQGGRTEYVPVVYTTPAHGGGGGGGGAGGAGDPTTLTVGSTIWTTGRGLGGRGGMGWTAGPDGLRAAQGGSGGFSPGLTHVTPNTHYGAPGRVDLEVVSITGLAIGTHLVFRLGAGGASGASGGGGGYGGGAAGRPAGMSDRRAGSSGSATILPT